MKRHLPLLRGGARLAADGFFGVLDAAQTVHQAVLDTAAPLNPLAPLLDRSTRLVYAGVRGVGCAAALAADHALALATRLAGMPLPEFTDAPGQLAWVSALNGALGDHLERSANPLALDLRFCLDGRPLALSPDVLHSALPRSERLALFVHGLGMNDRQWRRPTGADFPAQMRADLDCGVLALRYNTGRAIACNGAELSWRLQQLLDAHPAPPRDLVLIGHSMGGLVCRSALAQAQAQGLDWPRRVAALVCLGSPHGGAPLERYGEALARQLRRSRYTRAFARLADARSTGVKDLRDGRCLPDGITAAAEPGVPCFLVAAALGQDAADPRTRLLGDGVVPLDSALGRHADAARSLRVPASRRRVFFGTGHMDLLSHAGVYAQVRDWLATSPTP